MEITAGGLGQYWALPSTELLRILGASEHGLSMREAASRLGQFGPNRLRARARTDDLTLAARQFKSPLVLVLILAALVSLFLRDITNALIILGIVAISALLGYWQERGASRAVERLLATVQITAAVLRDGVERETPVDEVVPGDIISVSAGDTIPGDCRLLASKDLAVDEAALTGETFPTEKALDAVEASTPIAGRSNSLFLGTHVVSGTGTAVVVHTGRATEFGKVSERLRLRPPETDFERGLRRFGYFLLQVTLLLVAGIFAANMYLGRPFLDSFLFSVALAVGLTPELLPAVVTSNLAYGARRLAARKVIVRRLPAIENFGSMDVLCSDKTGTLTEGRARLHAALGVDGSPSAKAFLYAYLNAVLQAGFHNPIDEAIKGFDQPDIGAYRKLDEVPYDFVRKRLSVLVSEDSSVMITKGALADVLSACATAELADGTTVDIGVATGQVRQQFTELGGQGFRVLGLAYKPMRQATSITRDDEQGMILLGLLAFYDPPKEDVAQVIQGLREAGIALKVISGDNRIVAERLGRDLGLAGDGVLTGPQIQRMSAAALVRRVDRVSIFAEVEPNQKEHIITALKKAGHVVGFMGDGINDASALHAADVGISVDSAVDVAKEAADIVLLEKDLGVLLQGVRGGRAAFANTLKYVFMATSANFGNMFSMAGASLFLSFLPLLPKQILLTNLMTDLPESTIAMDNVDPDLTERPRRWDIRAIRGFMLTFGPLSSIFDYATFGILLLVLHATADQFRTGWFLESVVSATTIVLVIRTSRPFFRSRPGKLLAAATGLVIAATVLLPYLPVSGVLGFTPLPPLFLALMLVIVLLYVAAAEVTKRIFFRRTRQRVPH